MDILQDVVVTLVALGAAAVLWRRVFTTFRPAGGGARCASCQTQPSRTAAACGSATPAQPQPLRIMSRESIASREHGVPG